MKHNIQTVFFILFSFFIAGNSHAIFPTENSQKGSWENKNNEMAYSVISGESPFEGKEGKTISVFCTYEMAPNLERKEGESYITRQRFDRISLTVVDNGNLSDFFTSTLLHITSPKTVVKNTDGYGIKLSFSDSSRFVIPLVETEKSIINGLSFYILSANLTENILDKIKNNKTMNFNIISRNKSIVIGRRLSLDNSMSSINSISSCI